MPPSRSQIRSAATSSNYPSAWKTNALPKPASSAAVARQQSPALHSSPNNSSIATSPRSEQSPPSQFPTLSAAFPPPHFTARSWPPPPSVPFSKNFRRHEKNLAGSRRDPAKISKK